MLWSLEFPEKEISSPVSQSGTGHRPHDLMPKTSREAACGPGLPCPARGCGKPLAPTGFLRQLLGQPRDASHRQPGDCWAPGRIFASVPGLFQAEQPLQLVSS